MKYVSAVYVFVEVESCKILEQTLIDLRRYEN